MTSIVGTWDVTLRTPVGSIDVVYTFREVGGDGLVGTAAARDEEVRLHDIAVRHEPDGDHVTWRQSVTRPMRLNLDFAVLVAEDVLRGHSRAGRLPRSGVVGTRRGRASEEDSAP